MIKRKQRALVGFFLVYVTFAALFVALLAYTPGLSFEEDAGKVYIRNDSFHIVKNVKVELSDGTPVDCIAQLMPGSKRDLNISEAKRPSRITAEAPFHPLAEKTLFPLGKKGFTLAREVLYDAPAQAGKQFELKLKLCAENADLGKVFIRETHDESFFKEEMINRVIILPMGKCSEESYWLTPLQAGKTKIVFTLEAEGYATAIEEEIRVK